MAKKAYIGVNSVAHKIKKGYIGVNSVARRIKKAYIGIGGVARPCWSNGIEYYGTITPLSVHRARIAATTVGNYALFGGGANDTSLSTRVATIDVYTASLGHNASIELSAAKCWCAATTVDNFAIFAEGYLRSSAKTVDVYDSALTHTTPITDLSPVRYKLAATTVGNYALFAGGVGEGVVVNVYNDFLVKQTGVEDLSQDRYNLAATTVGNYGLFAGGADDDDTADYATVDAYDTGLTHTVITELSDKKAKLAATTIGSYALFGGGIGANGYSSSIVDAYNTSLTRSIITELSQERHALAATTVGDYAIFAGGVHDIYGDNSTPNSSIVDIYDSSLTRTIGTELEYATYGLAATTVGDYAIFAGGVYHGGNGGEERVYAYAG